MVIIRTLIFDDEAVNVIMDPIVKVIDKLGSGWTVGMAADATPRGRGNVIHVAVEAIGGDYSHLQAEECLRKNKYELILLDSKVKVLNEPGNDYGFRVLARLAAEYNPRAVIAVITAFRDALPASIPAGIQVYEKLEWQPDNPDMPHLLEAAREAAQPSSVDEETIRSLRAKGFIATMASFGALLGKIRAAISCDQPILLTGETGTGKDLLAKTIHELGERGQGRFVEPDIVRTTTELAESLLFGYEKGAFTDARTPKSGAFEMAAGGTLFLNEIGEMNPEVQLKFLHALEARRGCRIGGTVEIDYDVRLIAATSKNLEEAVGEGQFRKDLYFRLNVMTIHLPPLRERGTIDKKELLNCFLDQESTLRGHPLHFLPKDKNHLIEAYSWPGNIRQMKNLIKGLVKELRPEDKYIRLPFDWEEISKTPPETQQVIDRKTIVECARKHGIELSNAFNYPEILIKTRGNAKARCELLGHDANEALYGMDPQRRKNALEMNNGQDEARRKTVEKARMGET